MAQFRIGYLKVWAGFLILALIVFLPALSSEFLAYDDRINILDNPYINAGDFFAFWTKPYFNLFVPVVYSVWTALHHFFGFNPFFYHALNVVIHSLNAWLIFMLFLKFSFSRRGALVASAVFLLHPLQVEAVVWATGLKDVLSLFFCLYAVNLYFAGRGRWLIFVCLVLAVLCKPVSGVVPALLLFYSYRAGTLRKDGYLFLAALAGGANLLFSKTLQECADLGKLIEVALIDRLPVMLDSLGFYVSRFFVPLNLYPDYGRTPLMVLQNFNYLQNSAVALLFLGALIFLLRKKRFLVFFFVFAALFFLPTSGIVPFGFQSISTTADRYFYPVCLAFAALLGFVYEYFSGRNKKLTDMATVAFLSLFAFCSFAQSTIWKNNQVFFEYMLEGNPLSYNANNNLGVLARQRSDDDAALAFFEKARAIRPLEITPIAGLMAVYYVRKDHARLDAIAAEYLSEEHLATMVLPAYSTSVALKLYGHSLLERNRKEEAFGYFCRASEKAQHAKRELAEIMSTLSAELGKKGCPPL